MHRALSDEPGQMLLQSVVSEWNDSWRVSQPKLQVYDEGDRLRFLDTRPVSRQSSWTAGESESEIYRLCDSAQTPAALTKQLSALHGRQVSLSEIESTIDRLVYFKVLLPLNGKLLALGVCNVDC
jgi:magnesium-protoporphyrin IX monomethyl ester (oxidative) cyclase